MQLCTQSAPELRELRTRVCFIVPAPYFLVYTSIQTGVPFLGQQLCAWISFVGAAGGGGRAWRASGPQAVFRPFTLTVCDYQFRCCLQPVSRRQTVRFGLCAGACFLCVTRRLRLARAVKETRVRGEQDLCLYQGTLHQVHGSSYVPPGKV